MPDMKRFALNLVFWSVLLQVCCGQQAFLQSQLPLKVLLATPSELAIERATAAAQAVTLTGRQAITVRLGLFSAAVTVWLGSQLAVATLLQRDGSMARVAALSSGCVLVN
jgi:hypothetical protein